MIFLQVTLEIWDLNDNSIEHLNYAEKVDQISQKEHKALENLRIPFSLWERSKDKQNQSQYWKIKERVEIESYGYLEEKHDKENLFVG